MNRKFTLSVLIFCLFILGLQAQNQLEFKERIYTPESQLFEQFLNETYPEAHTEMIDGKWNQAQLLQDFYENRLTIVERNAAIPMPSSMEKLSVREGMPTPVISNNFSANLDPLNFNPFYFEIDYLNQEEVRYYHIPNTQFYLRINPFNPESFSTEEGLPEIQSLSTLCTNEMEVDIIVYPAMPGEGETDYKVYYGQEIFFEGIGVGITEFEGEPVMYNWTFSTYYNDIGLSTSYTSYFLQTYEVRFEASTLWGCFASKTINIEVVLNTGNIGPGCPGVTVETFDENVLLNTSSDLDGVDQYVVIPYGDDETTLNAQYLNTGSTDTYFVEAIDYDPIIPFGGTNWTSITQDDSWSQIINLGFDFGFFGDYYDKALINSNGAITFSIAGPGGNSGLYTPNSGSQWILSGDLPGNSGDARFKLAIMGVNQDTNPANSFDNWSISYELIGEEPCRTLAFSMKNLGQFSCGTSVGPQTYNMVIYETTNIIEVYVENRTPCTSWNNGYGIIGIQNADATEAYWPEGRNTGDWSATEEAWRFTPVGEENQTQFQWLNENGEQLSTENQISVGPGIYTAQTFYYNNPDNETGRPSEDKPPIIKNKTVRVYEGFYTSMEGINDLTVCAQPGNEIIYDLTLIKPALDEAENPDDYAVKYYTNEVRAKSNYNPIANPEYFVSNEPNQTIYVRVAKNGILGNEIGSFQLSPVFSGTAHKPDDVATTSEFYDLTQINTQVLGNQDASDYTIDFYWTLNDLLAEENPIENPENFEIPEMNVEIFVRLNSVDSDCFDYTSFTIVGTMGLDKYSPAGVVLWPNPVNDILNIQAELPIQNMVLLDIQGKEILVVKENNVNLDNLSPGIYFLRIQSEKGSEVHKIIKK